MLSALYVTKVDFGEGNDPIIAGYAPENSGNLRALPKLLLAASDMLQHLAGEHSKWAEFSDLNSGEAYFSTITRLIGVHLIAVYRSRLLPLEACERATAALVEFVFQSMGPMYLIQDNIGVNEAKKYQHLLEYFVLRFDNLLMPSNLLQQALFPNVSVSFEPDGDTKNTVEEALFDLEAGPPDESQVAPDGERYCIPIGSVLLHRGKVVVTHLGPSDTRNAIVALDAHCGFLSRTKTDKGASGSFFVSQLASSGGCTPSFLECVTRDSVLVKADGGEQASGRTAYSLVHGSGATAILNRALSFAIDEDVALLVLQRVRVSPAGLDPFCLDTLRSVIVNLRATGALDRVDQQMDVKLGGKHAPLPGCPLNYLQHTTAPTVKAPETTVSYGFAPLQMQDITNQGFPDLCHFFSVDGSLGCILTPAAEDPLKKRAEAHDELTLPVEVNLTSTQAAAAGVDGREEEEKEVDTVQEYERAQDTESAPKLSRNPLSRPTSPLTSVNSTSPRERSRMTQEAAVTLASDPCVLSHLYKAVAALKAKLFASSASAACLPPSPSGADGSAWTTTKGDHMTWAALDAETKGQHSRSPSVSSEGEDNAALLSLLPVLDDTATSIVFGGAGPSDLAAKEEPRQPELTPPQAAAPRRPSKLVEVGQHTSIPLPGGRTLEYWVCGRRCGLNKEFYVAIDSKSFQATSLMEMAFRCGMSLQQLRLLS